MKWLLSRGNFWKSQTFSLISDKTHICSLKISWRSPLFNSSRHLAIPLFVDWLPTGQWSAVGSAVLKRGSELLHCQQGGDADNPNLDVSKDSFKISPVFFVNSCCWLCSCACLISLIAIYRDDSWLSRAAQQFIYPWLADGRLILRYADVIRHHAPYKARKFPCDCCHRYILTLAVPYHLIILPS